MIVTRTPKAPYHSAFLGAFIFTPDSMNPKSEIKLRAAMESMNTVMPMPIGPEECKNGIWNGVRK